ncbi:MAG: hypothetical protein HY779_02265 [Rubrobacteridae bacterium]|nr:hypothetical protein [Rubrobacteridae bacterium]
MIDAVAMDIKTSFGKYPAATGVKRDFSVEAKESIELFIEACTRGDIELEFRTTVVPGLVELSDVVDIAKTIAEAYSKQNDIRGMGDTATDSNNLTPNLTPCSYYLQQFNPKTVMQKKMSEIKPYAIEQLEQVVTQASKYVPTFLRGK